MKYTTAAIIVSTLFSLSSCHSHRAVESTAGLQTHTETADSVAATRRTTASAKEASETVEINFFAPDSTGRQAVRSISRHRRLAAEERTDTVAGAATGVSIGTTEQTTLTRRLPTRYRLSLAALLAAATTLILITFTIKKRQ
ncbi:unknown [Prevotella sp. CAG:279]|nr:unknown [Prevotella sp. CAG:279]